MLRNAEKAKDSIWKKKQYNLTRWEAITKYLIILFVQQTEISDSHEIKAFYKEFINKSASENERVSPLVYYNYSTGL